LWHARRRPPDRSARRRQIPRRHGDRHRRDPRRSPRTRAQHILGANAAEDLLEIFVRRHEAASTLITTNRPTQDWGVFLGDVPAATAILDRFLAHASIVQMTGKSYRLRQRSSAADD